MTFLTKRLKNSANENDEALIDQLKYLLGKNYFGNDGFQNYLIFHSLLFTKTTDDI